MRERKSGSKPKREKINNQSYSQLLDLIKTVSLYANDTNYNEALHYAYKLCDMLRAFATIQSSLNDLKKIEHGD